MRREGRRKRTAPCGSSVEWKRVALVVAVGVGVRGVSAVQRRLRELGMVGRMRTMTCQRT
jgi:hypothetical protein